MKTNELISELKKLDPEGNAEVTCDGLAIQYIEIEPGYYDGHYQVLVRDEKNRTIGIKYTKEGNKILLKSYTTNDYIINKELEEEEIDYSSLNEESQIKLKKFHEEHRQWYLNLKRELEIELFEKWLEEKLLILLGETFKLETDYKNIAYHFFNKNLSINDPLPKGLYQSYNYKRFMSWDNIVEISLKDGYLKLTKKENINEK